MDEYFVAEVLRIYVAFIVTFRMTSHATPCNDIHMAADGFLSSGSYTFNNENGQNFQIFCQFYNGYGYAFISNNTDVNVNVSSLMDDTTHVVIRHKRVNGKQFTSTIEQLPKYSSVPILVQYNAHIGYNEISNSQMSPYIYVGFIPTSRATKGNKEGWTINGNELTFTNCDGNPNSYFALLLDHSQNGYTRTGISTDSLLFSWYSSASQLQQGDHLPDEFFTSQFEIHHGGCGGFATSNAVSDIVGVAVGIKFSITCSSPVDITAGSSSYTDTSIGGVVTYTCDAGYVMVQGNSTRTCGASGKWSGTLPTCKELSNVALGKHAYQTDTYCCGQSDAGLAVDGGSSQYWNDGSCSRTETKSNSYWEVDLGDVFEIDHVTVFGRIDTCCDDHLRQVEVYTGTTQAAYELAVFHDAIINQMHTFQMRHLIHARWVKITRTSGVDEQLSLCEVQVMGYKSNFMLYKKVVEVKGTGNVIRTYSSSAVTDCCRKCLRTSGCVAVNLDTNTSVCYLLDSQMQTTSVDQNNVFFVADYRTA